jgi:hypothetical protein
VEGAGHAAMVSVISSLCLWSSVIVLVHVIYDNGGINDLQWMQLGIVVRLDYEGVSLFYANWVVTP